jgi:hypothetical protein
VGGVDSTCLDFGAQRHGGGEEVKNEFYKKLHKFCNMCDIVILLIVACLVMFVSSNHVVDSMVVV